MYKWSQEHQTFIENSRSSSQLQLKNKKKHKRRREKIKKKETDKRRKIVFQRIRMGRTENSQEDYIYVMAFLASSLNRLLLSLPFAILHTDRHTRNLLVRPPFKIFSEPKSTPNAAPSFTIIMYIPFCVLL